MYGLGIDIGSTASKVVIVDGNASIATTAICGLGAGTSGAGRALSHAFENLRINWDDINFSVATGYGRQRFERADAQISELSCHAKGMARMAPGTRTIIDIGGQDAKALRLGPDGTLENFVMNEKCAAGTGRFLDVMARVLEADVDGLGRLDAQSTRQVEISSTCTVFAESEVISHLSAAQEIPDIVAGIHRSVAKRTAGLVRRLGPIVQPVAMSGGVARNAGVVRALERELGVHIDVPESCQLCGALGAALFAIERAKRA